ncbi:hypothetical protein BC832DRAFT_614980 [Gaertneriomyces semiglobifer]|nr:hypothetical protein BC832DRAFT_614980 [Gaertneriomyces semiglobifer]
MSRSVQVIGDSVTQDVIRPPVKPASFLSPTLLASYVNHHNLSNPTLVRRPTRLHQDVRCILQMKDAIVTIGAAEKKNLMQLHWRYWAGKRYNETGTDVGGGDGVARGDGADSSDSDDTGPNQEPCGEGDGVWQSCGKRCLSKVAFIDAL